MEKYKNLPVDLKDRLRAFSIDTIPFLLAITIVAFMNVSIEVKISILSFVFFEFNIFPSHFKRGFSLGKFSSGIKVVNEDYTDVSLIKMYLREIFIFSFGILTFGLYFVVALSLLGQNNDKQSIHDFLFNTRVVYINPNTK